MNTRKRLVPFILAIAIVTAPSLSAAPTEKKVTVYDNDIHYVAQAGQTPEAPYTNWATAAQTIQDAVDYAVDGDTVLVSNGVYMSGGRVTPGPGMTLTNRVVITNAISVRSVNGASHTSIRGSEAPGGGNGDGAVRCVYMDGASSLDGFTLYDGHTAVFGLPPWGTCGGGVLTMDDECEIARCVITGNSAQDDGGGVSGGTLKNCLMHGNTAGWNGGGACCSDLDNCTVSGNTAGEYGGGTCGGTIRNSIVYYNSAGISDDNYHDGEFLYSCTTPFTNAPGNTAAEPGFEDKDEGDYHLVFGSPCMDTATNAYMPDGPDLDGNPRLLDGDYDGTATVDMGAYEAAFVFVDLAVDKSVDNPEPVEYGTIAYELTVTNNGPEDATGVEVTDVLPAGVTYVSDTGSYNSGNGQWTVGSLASGASTSVTIVATIDDGTMGAAITNEAWISDLNETDFEAGNDTATAVVTVQIVASDLAVTKTAAPPAPEAGDTVTYTVTVVNDGPDEATGVEITDVLPAGVTFLSANPDQGAYNSVSGEWTVGSLAVGADAVLTIQARVNTPVGLSAVIPNPEPAGRFGMAVAGVGSDRFVVGNEYDDPGGIKDAGSVFLFDTNGTLLVTITNPAATEEDYF